MMNTFEQLKEAVKTGVVTERQAIAVTYCACPKGRMGAAQCDKTSVWSPFFETDPKAHWNDRGAKTFVGNRAQSLPEALAWASKEFGIKEWKGNAMRDKVPAIVAKSVPMRRA